MQLHHVPFQGTEQTVEGVQESLQEHGQCVALLWEVLVDLGCVGLCHGVIAVHLQFLNPC
jgi:hypothetical protein